MVFSSTLLGLSSQFSSCARIQGGNIQTIFPTEDEKILFEAAELAKEVKSSRQFTDIQKFMLMCNDCKIRLNGQMEARQHAKETGHMNFGEVAV